MAKEEVVSSAKAPDRLQIIWMAVSKDLAWLEFKPKKPDFKELGAQMEKAKKPADFVLSFDGKKLAFFVRVGSAVTPLGSQDVAGVKDPHAKYALLQKIARHTMLLSVSQLPPDPAEVEERTRRVQGLKQQLDNWEKSRKALPKKYDDLDQGQQEIGLGNWAKRKGYDRFPRFLMAVDWGRAPDFIVEEFLRDGAPSPVKDKLKPATRKALLDAHANGGKPDFTAARKEIVQLVDGFMMPGYAKDSLAGIDAEIKRLKAELARELKELKPLVGR